MKQSSESGAVTVSEETLEEVNRLWTIVRAYSNTAHSVNNALQVISGTAELLGVRSDIDPVSLRRLETIRTQAGKVASAINDLLEYSRSTSGLPQSLDLDRVVTMAVGMRASTLNRAGIRVEITRSGDRPFMVESDHGKLLQLLLNLLLVAESQLLNRSDASLVVELTRETDHMRLSVVGTAAPKARLDRELARSLGSLAAVTTETQDRVTAGLAAAAGGTLTVSPSDDDLPILTLTLPSNSPP